jgi:uncharacterized membrane protein
MFAVLIAMVLQFLLPSKLLAGLGPSWLIPALEGAFALALLVANPRSTKDTAQLRLASLSLVGLINAANVVSLGKMVARLINGTTHAAGRSLIFASAPIWLTNVIVFALWYWELDRGGPAARLQGSHHRPDFLFPQMTTPAAAPPHWVPTFWDYLYTSFTNATAFSPTDTMPLTDWAKVLMMVQSLASLLTIGLVVSRAVNILS